MRLIHSSVKAWVCKASSANGNSAFQTV